MNDVLAIDLGGHGRFRVVSGAFVARVPPAVRAVAGHAHEPRWGYSPRLVGGPYRGRYGGGQDTLGTAGGYSWRSTHPHMKFNMTSSVDSLDTTEINATVERHINWRTRAARMAGSSARMSSLMMYRLVA